ncbi:hypothetical protein ACFOOK_02555 [Micromonospora krabiensis]|uniref:Uncharacterized protein n=1 Tax=Micromonospora krabiensis TaxID=307121 RepID=A0A1C3MWQ2_9ACTN|nr:hypothetical protein [Micromonospora krabiensis]SBV24759.1 hypothetical protein GA0070620_0198 [Micromonospora krabiensis]
MAAGATIGFVALGIALTPSVASASASAVMADCQAASAALRYRFYQSDGSIGSRTYDCSGDKSLNSRGYDLRAGGWSGIIYGTSGPITFFCDGETLPLNGQRVTGIWMKPGPEPYEQCS